MTLYIRGFQGIGDQLHSRPFVRAVAAREEVYLATPWPQLWRDIPVKCCRWGSRLRTQARNEQSIGYAWHEPPPGARVIDLRYGNADFDRGGISDAIERLLTLEGAPYVHDAPDFGAPPVSSPKPIAVIRPVTIRREWLAVARNCEPSYIAQAAVELQLAGFHVVSIADLVPNVEWIDGETPPADQRFHAGELTIEQIMALIAHAAIVVGPIGFSLHAAICYRTPTICIAGGRGHHCAPWKETDPRQDLSRVRWIMPDRYCVCDLQAHPCLKAINDFAGKFRRALASLDRRRLCAA